MTDLRARALDALAAADHRAALLGVRQLRHPVQGLRPARRRPRPVREARGRRPGAPVHRRRPAGLAAHPVGPRRRLRQARRARRRPGRRDRRDQLQPVPGRRLPARLADPRRRRPSAARRSTTTPSASRSCSQTGSPTSRSGCPTAPTTRARTTCAPGRTGWPTRSQQIYAMLGPDHRMLLEYKFFEPYFYAMDIPDWGTSLVHCLALGEQATVVLDTGHHAPGTNIEFIVMQLLRAGAAGRLRLQLAQLRRRRPHRRLGRPVPAVPDHERDRRQRRPAPGRPASTSCSTSATTSSRRSPARSGR